MKLPFPIVDAHHHLWDLERNSYPWLTGKMMPKVFGDHYELIRNTFLMKDLLNAAAEVPLAASVHIQAEFDPLNPVGETAWLEDVANDPMSRGMPNAFVVAAALESDDLEATLEKHLAYSNVRGVRQTLHHRAELANSPKWRSGLAVLAGTDLTFDLSIFPSQVDDVIDLIDRHTTLQFALCHTGFPQDQSNDGRAAWVKAMTELAMRPNVVCKVSGFAMWDRAWTPDSIRPFVLEAIDIFGADRCAFGSNFPVDSLGGSYLRIWQSFDEITKKFSVEERSALFGSTAARLYRVEIPATSFLENAFHSRSAS